MSRESEHVDAHLCDVVSCYCRRLAMLANFQFCSSAEIVLIVNELDYVVPSRHAQSDYLHKHSAFITIPDVAFIHISHLNIALTGLVMLIVIRN